MNDLIKLIEKERQKLLEIYTKNQDFKDKKLLEYSEKLDELIVRFIKESAK